MTADFNQRILARDTLMSNDTRATGINNNDLIVGPSGAGKTRSYVKPNIMQCSGSMVVADTKGSLRREVGPLLRRRGYRIVNIDFTDTLRSDGYNPLDYIRYDPAAKKYREQDVVTLCAALVPVETQKDPFWERSARNLLSALVGYVLEALPEKERSLEYVVKLFTTDGPPLPQGRSRPVYDALLEELALENPDSFAVRQYRLSSLVQGAKTTESCILSFLAEKLAPLSYDGPVRMYRRRNRVDFRALGQERTAVFLNVSDTDRSMDALVNAFYTQALHTLCESADRDYDDHRLPVPVRFIFDDFATNACIPDFDKIISVIRSREISASIILQSISQLNAIYGKERSMTIINNCDNCLYLGGQDVDTATYMALKANKTLDTILNMPLDSAWLFTRGRRPREVSKFDIRTHAAYRELPEAASQRLGKEAPWSQPETGAEPRGDSFRC